MANDRARKGGCAFSPGWSAAESWVSRMTRVRAGFSRRHMCRPYGTRGIKGSLPRTAPPKSGGLSWAELSRPAVAGRDSRQVSLQGKTGSRRDSPENHHLRYGDLATATTLAIVFNAGDAALFAPMRFGSLDFFEGISRFLCHRVIASDDPVVGDGKPLNAGIARARHLAERICHQKRTCLLGSVRFLSSTSCDFFGG